MRLNVFSKEVGSNNTKCRGKKFIVLYEAFERIDEMKLMMKFDQCGCTISLNLEIYIFPGPWRMVLGVTLGKY